LDFDGFGSDLAGLLDLLDAETQGAEPGDASLAAELGEAAEHQGSSNESSDFDTPKPARKLRKLSKGKKSTVQVLEPRATALSSRPTVDPDSHLGTGTSRSATREAILRTRWCRLERPPIRLRSAAEGAKGASLPSRLTQGSGRSRRASSSRRPEARRRWRCPTLMRGELARLLSSRKLPKRLPPSARRQQPAASGLWRRKGRRVTEARSEVDLTRRQRGRRPWSGRL
jgi:hypothetical protein